MLQVEPSFRRVVERDGYPRLEDLGLIGDGTTAALVGLDGTVWWLCVPRFDAEPLVCGLLDRQRGGRFVVAPAAVVEARHWYEADTAVLVTELRTPTGLMRLTDALVVRAGADLSDDSSAARREFVRSVLVLDGNVELRVVLEPKGGATARVGHGGLDIEAGAAAAIPLHLRASRPLDGLSTEWTLSAGEQVDVVLSWGGSSRHHRFSCGEMLAATADAWRRWLARFAYDGPEAPMVRRAAITLKLCDHWISGALVAAPTASLPAPVGGERNWDYRYTWIRDAAFSVYALRRVGFPDEANAFLGWVLDAFERSGTPRIMYTVTAEPVPDERSDPALEGYRGSAPVRWGNAAADQQQHDVYGEVLDCAHQWVSGGGTIEPHLWSGLVRLADAAGRAWKEPDQGIWEVRSPGRVFTYSAALCHVALDRAARIGMRLGLRGPIDEWRAAADSLRDQILERAWDEDRETLSEHLDGGGSLDASLLALPIRRVIAADHPRMVATTNAIASRLSAGDGLLYRYLHDESPDGISGDEGAFVLCSFWLVDNLAHQGRLAEAAELYASLCARASPLGLLPEQIDPATGEFSGNFPQAFSHIGVISSGVTLARLGVAS